MTRKYKEEEKHNMTMRNDRAKYTEEERYN